MSTLRPSPVYLCCPDLNSELAVHHVRKAIHKSPYGAKFKVEFVLICLLKLAWTINKNRKGEFSRYGGSSGGYPDKLWPSHSRLQELAAEERERHPPMEVMLDNIAARERERERERESREKIIAANMAKMSKMIADWKKLKKEAKQKQREEEIKRDKLLAEVREQFGYALDPPSAKFKEMFGEIEKEKKKRKLLKSRKREEEQGTVAAESRQQILLYSATVTYCKIGYFVSLESEKLIPR
ncbi:growth arrest and DNA damage-inducible proteins-interacting protein 1-like [Carassius gibelio]|uniref:growth arrest and DNA damage-inducible proteins-interacting protein 1-like n=1 Tax=Carassius gibelio TaxID=101364 RepID=UPI002277562C|nr:growth arrest and DNA damage-inducible proteins-interacting protein 1-like [Carassius gibelio]